MRQYDRNQVLDARKEWRQHERKLVVQPDQYGGDGLFARRRLYQDEVDLSYMAPTIPQGHTT